MIVIRNKGSKLFYSRKDNILLLFEIKEITNLSNLMIAQEVLAMESHPVFLTCLSFVLAIHCITSYPFFLSPTLWRRFYVTDVICNLTFVGLWRVKATVLPWSADTPSHEIQYVKEISRTSSAGARSTALTHTEGFGTWILGKKQLAKTDIRKKKQSKTS